LGTTVLQNWQFAEIKRRVSAVRGTTASDLKKLDFYDDTGILQEFIYDRLIVKDPYPDSVGFGSFWSAPDP
jgi:hypothetical protein